MPKGLERRDASETNTLRSLRSSADIQSATLERARTRGRLPNVQIASSNVQRTLGKFREYADAAIGRSAALEHERSQLDGQMAQLQGKTFEEVKMGGDKFALQGYRIVEAQERASALLTAQQVEIEQTDYELSPDEFRNKFANRIDGVMEGVSDPRTRDLIREQVLKQMPVLVDQHTTRHLDNAEKRNFDTLTRSIDTISSDPTAGDTLVAFAKGEPGSATSGLSDDRRQEAVVSGIVKSFSNDNPAAYAILSGEGLLSELPTAQQQAIRSAKKKFENRARKTYNADFIKEQDDLSNRIANGELEPQQAMEAYASLLEDYNITINQQEAGAVYTQAKDGVRTRKINTAVAVDDAVVRGDQDSAIDLIIKSLTSTESGGNPLATITIEDGRQFGGLLQMGKGRLMDYHKATGGPLYTPEQFRKLSAEDQNIVNRWQVADILNTIKKEGLDKYIGSEIKGTTITYSGLVAVAHLGGKGGLRKFLKTGGKYDPHDGSNTRKGTHLSDYLRKHGNGVELTPEQARRSAKQRIAMVREQAAIKTYEMSQPRLDELDAAYSQGGLSRDKWIEQRRAVYDDFDRARTMADAKYERQLTNKVKEDAFAIKKEGTALRANVKLEKLEMDFEKAAKSFETGKINHQEFGFERNKLITRRQEVMTEYGIKLNSEKEINQMRAQVKRIARATKERLQFGQDQAEINSAEISGTLMELSPRLREQAINAQRERAIDQVQDAIASKQATPEQVEALHGGIMLDYYAKTGMVDGTLERTMNSFLSGSPIDKSGNARPEYVEAVNQYRLLAQRNPTLADKYVRKENKDMLDAVVSLAGSGPLEGVIASVGRRKDEAPRTQSTEDFLKTSRVIDGISDNVQNYIDREEIGVVQAVVSSDADLQQIFNRSWFDPYGIDDEVNKKIVTDRLRDSLEDAHRRSPNISASELIEATGRRVQERSPIIGGNVVSLPLNGPSAGERFFGARSADFTDQAGAINDAVMDYFRTPEFVKANPSVEQTTLADFLPEFLPEFIRGDALAGSGASTVFTGVRPFKMYYNSTDDIFQVQFSLPGRGTLSEAIVLDPRLIGKQYIAAHNAASAD